MKMKRALLYGLGAAVTAINSLMITALVALLLLASIVGVYLTQREVVEATIHTIRTLGFAWKMDRIYDSLPDKPMQIKNGAYGIIDEPYIQWGVMTNSRDLEKVVEVVVPYFYYEFGFKTHYPKLAAFIPFEDEGAFHILGQACCIREVAVFNYGYVNPYARFYRHDSLLPTIVHELGHVNQICSPGGGKIASGFMEAANQLVTIEIMAAMSNHSLDYAVKPTIGELRDWAMAYSRFNMRAGGFDAFYKWFALSFIYDTVEEQARAQKAWRYWDEREIKRPLELDNIIYYYSWLPYTYMNQALDDPGFLSPEGIFAYPNKEHRIKLDDTAYFLSHLPEMVRIGRHNGGER